jgi:hypothetical protein
VGLTTLPPPVCRMSENVGASTSRNPKGLHGLCGDNFIFTYLRSSGACIRCGGWCKTEVVNAVSVSLLVFSVCNFSFMLCTVLSHDYF